MYICKECSHSTTKWIGKCTKCKAWDSMIEEQALNKLNNSKVSVKKLSSTSINVLGRQLTGFDDIDKLLGGGLVCGSSILIGGDPGIGKSTLLLQIAAVMQDSCLYVAGEESPSQIALRAQRLGLTNVAVHIQETNSLEDIFAALDEVGSICFMIIDSIQTLFSKEIIGGPGSVAQVRMCTYKLVSFAKANGITLIIVGHVTKDGQIAGPKMLEHMVDVVLYFEGESKYNYRILRSIKNRFGEANDIAILEMRHEGLHQISNPSSFFIGENNAHYSGISVFAGLEGTSPILIEVQALLATTNMVTPRRAVVGWDVNRLAMIVAVLHSRFGISLYNKEIYLNVAGGFKINDPAADLAVAAALISAHFDNPLPERSVVCGEIALSGEVRKISSIDKRLKEAKKMGFQVCIIPRVHSNHSNLMDSAIYMTHIRDFSRLVRV